MLPYHADLLYNISVHYTAISQLLVLLWGITLPNT